MKYSRVVAVLLFSLVSGAALFAGGGAETLPPVSTEHKGYPRGKALISVQELKTLVDAKAPNLVIIAAENAASFALGHIPGAVQVDRPAYAAAPATQDGVSGNILELADFTAFARNLGVNQDSQLVIYDDDFDATRLWWAFTYYGHANVRVLDGNIGTWRDAGYPVDFLVGRPVTQGNFTARIAYPKLRIDTDELASLLDTGKIQLWDTRDLEEFTGEAQRSGAVRAGRIPGAIFVTWPTFKTTENRAVWKTYAEIKAVLMEKGNNLSLDQVFYCQSGVRSTQAIFALYLAGWPLEKLRNYDSSWIGWSRSDLPLEKGPAAN